MRQSSKSNVLTIASVLIHYHVLVIILDLHFLKTK